MYLSRWKSKINRGRVFGGRIFCMLAEGVDLDGQFLREWNEREWNRIVGR